MFDLSAVTMFGRYAMTVYAAVATVLVTACLTLQALTALDRRNLPGAGKGHYPAGRRRRPLFLRVEDDPADVPDMGA